MYPSVLVRRICLCVCLRCAILRLIYVWLEYYVAASTCMFMCLGVFTRKLLLYLYCICYCAWYRYKRRVSKPVNVLDWYEYQ